MNHLIATLALALTPLSSDSDWPSWRGPFGNGRSGSETAPVSWGAEKNVKWKVPLAQPANGSPIVAGDRIFLTMPEDPEGKARSLYCYDRATGRELWKRTVELGRVMPTHRTNPYCGSTPASDGERVVVWHATAGLHCYDLDGKELWQRDLGEFKHQWGYGASPVIHKGRVILNTGPDSDTTLGFVTALDLKTGETVWRTDEPNHLDAEAIEKKRLAGSWSTPLIVPLEGGEQIICSQPTRVVAYNVKDGDVIWSSRGITSERGDLVYSSPVIAGDMCVVVGGYEGPTIGVRLGGRGDVTESHRAWRHDKQMSNCASGLYVDGFVYVPDMGGFLYCIEPATGEVLWKERVGRGSSWGSVVAAGERLYLMNQSGTTTVFKPSPEALEVVAENDLGEDTNSTPAIAGGEIFLRTHENLYCIAQVE